MDSCRVVTIYQRETLLMIADVIPATIGTKIPASLQTQAPQTDLHHHTRHMKLNGIIGLQITHLQGLPTLTRPPSPHMQLGTLMTLYKKTMWCGDMG